MGEFLEGHARGTRSAQALSITSIDEPNDVPLQGPQLSEPGANSIEMCVGDVSCLRAAATGILDEATKARTCATEKPKSRQRRINVSRFTSSLP
jgi:hypothetical protein